MRKIRIWIDNKKVGCGFRDFLVLRTGPKWTFLISTDNAETVKVPSSEMRFAQDMLLKPTRAARRLRNVAKTYGVDTVALKEALSGLRF